MLDAETGCRKESEPDKPLNPVWTSLVVFLSNNDRISIAELAVMEHNFKWCRDNDEFLKQTHA